MIAIYGEFNLGPQDTKNVTFDVTFNESYSTACIEDMACTAESQYAPGHDTFFDRSLAAFHEDPLVENFTVTNTVGSWPYETELEYSCAPGRAFQIYNASVGEDVYHQHLYKKCQWNSTWTPDNDPLPVCNCTYILRLFSSFSLKTHYVRIRRHSLH